MTTIHRLLIAVLLAASGSQVYASNSFEGHFRVNGKDTTLAHLQVRAGSPYMRNATTMLVFTEKDAGADTGLDRHAPGGKWGTALLVTLWKDGDEYRVVGSQFADPGLKDRGASAIGVLNASEVVVVGGRISGKLVSRPDAQVFGDAIDIDLHFDATLP